MAACGNRAALTYRFIKVGHLTVNRVLDFHDDCRAIFSVPIELAVPEVPKPARPRTDWTAHDQAFHRWSLFFEGGRELRILACEISRTSALVHSDGLGLLPIHFYITFDDFLTVGKCRIAWRYRDDIGVIFERWLDIRQGIPLIEYSDGSAVAWQFNGMRRSQRSRASPGLSRLREVHRPRRA